MFKQLSTLFLVFGMLNIAWADTINTPTTAEQIIQGLKKKPKTRDFFIPNRDIEGIVEDNNYQGKPKVAALVHFKIDSAEISLQADQLLLGEFGQALQSDELRQSILIIAGHTDNIGTTTYNLSLSHRRAQSVKKFLMKHHAIANQRLIVKAFGESRPIDSNKTEQGRAMNRRVEFIRID